jgi:hypothetical protein
MDGGTGDHRVKPNKTDSEGQILHVFSHMQNRDLNKNDVKVDGDHWEKIGDPWEGERERLNITKAQ